MTQVLRATWRRCQAHVAREALVRAGEPRPRIVPARIGIAQAREHAAAAHARRRAVAGWLRSKAPIGRMPPTAALMDAAKEEVLAHMRSPAAHRAKSHGANPIERLNGGVKRRTDVAGTFPNEAASSAWSAQSCPSGPTSGPPRLAPQDPGDHRRRQRR